MNVMGQRGEGYVVCVFKIETKRGREWVCVVRNWEEKGRFP